MLGRFLRSAGREALERQPRGAFGRYGGAPRSWRDEVAPHERAIASLPHPVDRNRVRASLTALLLGSALGGNVATAYSQRDDEPARLRRDLGDQRRLVDALNRELTEALFSDTREVDPSVFRSPQTRGDWIARRETRRLQHQRERRVREIISRLNTDYAGYEGRDAPDMGLVYDEGWNQ